MATIPIRLLLLTLVIALVHAVFLAPVSRPFLPGNTFGTWSLDASESSATCPTSIRHLAYLQTANPSVFKIRHIDISHGTIFCEDIGATAFISSAFLLDPTTHTSIPADVLKPFLLYLQSDKDYMLTAQRLAASGHIFYGIVELTARECSTASRFEAGMKGFFLANSTSDAFSVPPFEKELDPARKHMALYEGGTGGRRCLYHADIDVGPLKEPLNFLERPAPTEAVVKERAIEETPTPNASVSASPKPLPTPLVEEGSGNVFGDITNSNKTSSTRRACFSATARVLLRSGRHVRMEHLSVGDHVHVGQGLYSRVFMFTHQDPADMHPFVHLTSTSAHELQLSAGHYIYLNGALRPAATAKVGDTLLLADGSPTIVSTIQTVHQRGLYNPQTLSGDIAVNNILTSCYTTAVHPRAAHSLLAPLRAIHRILTCPLST